MNNKFFSKITGGKKGIEEQRALIVTEDAIDAQKEIVDALIKKERLLKRELLSLTDIFPDSTFSTRVVKSDFNAVTHFKEIHDKELELIDIQLELEIATKTFKEWFGEDEEANKE